MQVAAILTNCHAVPLSLEVSHVLEGEVDGEDEVRSTHTFSAPLTPSSHQKSNRQKCYIEGGVRNGCIHVMGAENFPPLLYVIDAFGYTATEISISSQMLGVEH